MLKGIPSLPFSFSSRSPIPEALSSLAAAPTASEPFIGDVLVGETLTSRAASTVVGGVDIIVVVFPGGRGRGLLCCLWKKCREDWGVGVENI